MYLFENKCPQSDSLWDIGFVTTPFHFITYCEIEHDTYFIVCLFSKILYWRKCGGAFKLDGFSCCLKVGNKNKRSAYIDLFDIKTSGSQGFNVNDWV